VKSAFYAFHLRVGSVAISSVFENFKHVVLKHV